MTSELVGIIGGSGFYSLLEDADEHIAQTPYGAPSGPVTVGTLADRHVAFVARHGTGHRFAPHVVPYRENLWALRSLGVRQVVSLSAVGSLRLDVPTGTLVVPDQIADRTHGRAHTFFDAGEGVGHVSFADPYCPRGRAAALGMSVDGALGVPVAPVAPVAPGAGVARVAPGAVVAGAAVEAVDGGTLVVINGPRFSSRAESLEFQSLGWSIIGMTAMPEAGLARELGLCYTTLALVTDLDAGVEAGEGVTHAAVLAQFAENLPRLRALLVSTLTALPATQGDCICGDRSGLPASFVPP